MNLLTTWKMKGLAIFTGLFLTMGFSEKNNAYAQPDGAALFKANCSACHHPTKVVVGPALAGAKKRWADAGIPDRIYDWVNNPKKTLDEGLPYVKTLVAAHDAKGVVLMTAQPLSKEEIDAVFAYAESAPAPGGDKSGFTPKFTPANSKAVAKGKGRWFWVVVFGVVFMVIIFSVGGVRRQLINANLEKLGKPAIPTATYWEEFKSWASRHKVLVSFIALFFVIGGLTEGWYALKGIGVYEGYKPEQPIWFSHEVHAGYNKISCQYCHSGVEKSRHATLPTAMVCMNCHKGIQEGSITGTNEISKIYKAVGFDPATGSYIKGYKQEPIKWVKVHALPDHVYFNHSQHVVVGQLDCKQCHGDMTQIDVAQIQPVDVLNGIEGNVKVEGGRPTLTMGWCIECHSAAEVKMDGNGYYDELKKRLLLNKEVYKKHLADEKITVKDLGGWECSKCHY
jgi:mono/diheme cytochrome c family protein